MLNDAFSYAKDGTWDNPKRWFLLLVSIVIFPFILGYIIRIYQGERPAPELDQWGRLFVNGLKFLVVQVIYAIPVILLIIVAFLPFLSAMFSAGLFTAGSAEMTDTQAEQFSAARPEILSSLGTMVLLLAVAVILAIFIGLFSFIGIVRFAWMGAVAEAFSFPAILGTIRTLGWINYLLALIVIGMIAAVYGFVMNLAMMISFFGFIIWFFLYPPLIIFTSRYSALVYEAAGDTVSAPNR